MIRLLKILTLLFIFSCSQQKKNAIKNVAANDKKSNTINFDTLPNGKMLLDTYDSAMVLYYKEVVGSDTLKGGVITCYGVDDSMRYFYLRTGNVLHLLNQSTKYQSPWSLGTLEEDYKTFFITRIDNGNGSPFSYQIFDKKDGHNILGDKIEALNYETYNDSLFFLYDNYTVSLTGNNIDRKYADSIFLYNATSGRRQGFKLSKEIPYDSYIGLEKIAKNRVTISWVKIMTDDKKEFVTYSR